jgi:phosphatidylglycerol:prolipoprotein diacylglycerol transferase
MHPILIDFGTHTLPFVGATHLFIPTYGALFAGGTLIAWLWFMRRARIMGLPADPVFNGTFYGLLAGIVGAKVALILVEWRYYLENPAEIVWTFRSAGVLMGGVFAGAVVFLLYARSHDLPVRRMGDAIVAPLAMAQALGRLGCLSAGCCYGVPTSSGFAVTFTDPASMVPSEPIPGTAGAALGVPLVPTQLLQMASDLTLAIVLTLLWRRRVQPDGTVLWLYVLLYSVSRGIIEFWRGDVERGLYFGGAISTSQILALLGALAALVMLLRGRIRREAQAGAL